MQKLGASGVAKYRVHPGQKQGFKALACMHHCDPHSWTASRFRIPYPVVFWPLKIHFQVPTCLHACTAVWLVAHRSASPARNQRRQEGRSGHSGVSPLGPKRRVWTCESYRKLKLKWGPPLPVCSELALAKFDHFPDLLRTCPASPRPTDTWYLYSTRVHTA